MGMLQVTDGSVEPDPVASMTTVAVSSIGSVTVTR
jgi:hypothetical protein